ncbi:MAG: hypothetical protein Q7T77_08820 [Sulfuricurvum sp.]|nr:hypothetical protein [Sulfuricurvum sp.]
MKIALVVFDTFEDYDLLARRLDKLNVSEVISGTSNGFEMLQEYVMTRSDVKISIAQKGTKKTQRVYNAIDAADYILIYTHKKGIKTKRSIEYAKKNNKKLDIYNHDCQTHSVPQTAIINP